LSFFPSGDPSSSKPIPKPSTSSLDDDDEEEGESDDEVIDYLPGSPSVADAAAVRLAEKQFRDLEVDSAAASGSPGSNRFSATSASPATTARRGAVSPGPLLAKDQLDPVEEGCHLRSCSNVTETKEDEVSTSKKKVSEQDAISDESGYSEESAAAANAGFSPKASNAAIHAPSSSAAKRGETLSGTTTVVNVNDSMVEERTEDCDSREEVDVEEADLTVRSGLVSELNVSPLASTTFPSSARITTEFCINI